MANLLKKFQERQMMKEDLRPEDVVEELAEPKQMGKVRDYSIKALSLLLSAFILFTAARGAYTATIQRGIPLMLACMLTILIHPSKKKWMRPFDVVCFIGSVVSIGYVLVNYEALGLRAGLETRLDFAIGIVGTILVIDVARRVSGWTLPIISIIFLFYDRFGRIFPGVLMHSNLKVERIVRYTWLSQEGIFGTSLGVMVSFVFLFIFFGCLLEKTGAGKNYIDLAYSLTGTFKSGPAQAAVVSSACFGTISGSSAANVVSTGTFTIPLMKKMGYTSEFAGAVEAVASNGGQIMPPIMGAAAFVMSDTLGVPFGNIVKAAVIPALIYYVSVAASVHLQAVKLGLRNMSRSELPNLKKCVIACLPYIIPLATLIIMLVNGYSATKAGFYGILLLLLCSLYSKENRKNIGKIILESCFAATKASLQLWGVVAVVGIVIASVTATGLGPNFAQLVIKAAGSSTVLALIITMIASIIMGMGLPTVACYMILAILVAPALTKMGVTPIAAHMFVFYFGIMSSLTPPVAIAAYAGAGVAKANPMKVGWIAVRLALAAFLVPYMFVFNNSLLMIGTPGGVLLSGLSAVLGSVILAVGTMGYFITYISWPIRVVAIISALALIYPGWASDIAGLVFFIAIVLYQQRKKKMRAAKGLHNNEAERAQKAVVEETAAAE